MSEILDTDMYSKFAPADKEDLETAIGRIGYSVEKGNFEVSVMTVIDRYNPGIIISYDLTLPLDEDETTYIKISFMFKHRCDVGADMGNINVLGSKMACILGLSFFAYITPLLSVSVPSVPSIGSLALLWIEAFA